MARLSPHRDHNLLGHAPRDPFASADAPYSNPDVNFSDVFGGPPRRSSVYQARPSPGEPAGGRGGRGSGGGGAGEEAAGPCRPWSSSFVEKPVFGGVGSPARRKLVGGDFFDDIFRREESASSTPRTIDREVFSSDPGSRVLSPARLLPPASDGLGRGSSLPAQLSFSTMPVSGSDHPAFGSPTRATPDVAYRNEKSISDVFGYSSPTAYAPTNSRRFVQTKDDPKIDTHASSNGSDLHCQTHHSHHRSLLEATKLASSRTNDTEMQLKKDSSGLQAYDDIDYFHFSMYKWASIEVTLVMPYNLKERSKVGTKVSRVSAEILQAADCPSDNQCVPQGCKTSHDYCDSEDKSQLSDLAAAEIHDISLTKKVKEVLTSSSDTKSVRSDTADKTDDMDTCHKDGVNVPGEAWRAQLKNLHHLPNDYSDREGDKDITGQTRNQESLVVDSTMKTKNANDPAKFEETTREKVLLRHNEKATKKMHDTPATQEDKTIGSRVKGKVKEFIKIFNQEPAPRSGGTVENQARRARTRNDVKGRVESHVSACVANADDHEKEKVDDEALSPTPVANQNLGIGEKPDSGRLVGMQNADNSSSEGKGLPSLFSDSTLDILDASFRSIEEAFIETVEECLTLWLKSYTQGLS